MVFHPHPPRTGTGHLGRVLPLRMAVPATGSWPFRDHLSVGEVDAVDAIIDRGRLPLADAALCQWIGAERVRQFLERNPDRLMRMVERRAVHGLPPLALGHGLAALMCRREAATSRPDQSCDAMCNPSLHGDHHGGETGASETQDGADRATIRGTSCTSGRGCDEQR